MEFRKWIKKNWDIVLGGIIPLVAFGIIGVLSMFDLLSGWVGLGVFAFTAWIAMFFALVGLISSLWRGYGVFSCRTLWFIPGLLVFASTIGANGLENLLTR